MNMRTLIIVIVFYLSSIQTAGYGPVYKIWGVLEAISKLRGTHHVHGQIWKPSRSWRDMGQVLKPPYTRAMIKISAVPLYYSGTITMGKLQLQAIHHNYQKHPYTQRVDYTCNTRLMYRIPQESRWSS